MKKRLLPLFFLLLLTNKAISNPPIYVAFQWHMHQPVYQPGETIIDSENSGVFSYSLYDVFTSRTGPYTTWPSNAVNKMLSMSHAGVQVSFSGSLIENLNVLESNSIAFSGWKSSWNSMATVKTSLDNQRLDMVAFGYHHPLMPLTDNADIQRQIQLHKAIFAKNFPNMPYSKGIFPPENAFEEHIIPALINEGIEWAMIDNQHFDRACSGHPWASGSGVVEPNKADQINANPEDWKQLTDLWAPIPVSAAWGHRPHWIKYVDPSTGTEYKMIAVPTSTYFGNEDGRGGFGALQYEATMSQLESYNTDEEHPILIVLHHDGDNYGGGTDSYYGSNFDSFVNWLNSNSSRFVCTTIQDYLDQFPPASDDIIHVEAGSWQGAGSDPEFLKWNGDPDDDGYSYDRNSWSVITATSNIVKTAEQIDASSPDTEAAWNYLTNAETSCYWYWDGTEDWDSKPTRASNLATEKAINVVNTGSDATPPSIYHPQREPYNPGGTEWGNTMPSDFTVWSYVYDVSGLQSVKLKYRKDKDGENPLSSNDNETYTGGEEVENWQEITMTANNFTSKTNPLPNYKADEYSAEITGLKDVLVDYYIEATDTKGNVNNSPIFHVYVGTNNGSSGNDSTVTNIGSYIISPSTPDENDTITVALSTNTAGAVLHWGVNDYEKPISEYVTDGSSYWSDNTAVRTPFELTGETYQAQIGPFNNAKQSVDYISFVVNYTGDNTWDNNGGSDYQIALLHPTKTSENNAFSLKIYPNPVQDKVMVNTEQTLKKIELISLFGSILKISENSTFLQISEFQEGPYLLRITFNDGSQKIEKIIKK